MATKMILDIDAAADSVTALLAAIRSPQIELAAVCTVFGAAPVQTATDGAQNLLALLCKEVPVYEGNQTPVTKHLTNPEVLPEKDGAAASAWPRQMAQAEKVQTTPAPVLYAEALRGAISPVTIVTTGPLTNLALALVIDPGIVRNIKCVIVAGGGEDLTDKTAAAEEAVWRDPQAAQMVLHSGADMLFVPLDAAVAAALAPQEVARMGTAGKVGILAEKAMALCPATETGAVMAHGALAVCAAANPAVLQQVEARHIEIGYFDVTDGQTVVDHRRRPDAPNCRFARAADKEAFARQLWDVFSKEAP